MGNARGGRTGTRTASGSRRNIGACDGNGITPHTFHKVNVTARGKGSGDAWGETAGGRLGGGRTAARLHEMGEGERGENQAYRKAGCGYGDGWTVEFVFSAFKRVFRDRPTARKRENMVQEAGLKIRQYNRWIDEGMVGTAWAPRFRDAGGGRVR